MKIPCTSSQIPNAPSHVTNTPPLIQIYAVFGVQFTGLKIALAYIFWISICQHTSSKDKVEQWVSHTLDGSALSVCQPADGHSYSDAREWGKGEGGTSAWQWHQIVRYYHCWTALQCHDTLVHLHVNQCTLGALALDYTISRGARC